MMLWFLSCLGWLDCQFGMQATSFVYGALMEACIRLQQVDLPLALLQVSVIYYVFSRVNTTSRITWGFWDHPQSCNIIIWGQGAGFIISLPWQTRSQQIPIVTVYVQTGSSVQVFDGYGKEFSLVSYLEYCYLMVITGLLCVAFWSWRWSKLSSCGSKCDQEVWHLMWGHGCCVFKPWQLWDLLECVHITFWLKQLMTNLNFILTC